MPLTGAAREVPPRKVDPAILKTDRLVTKTFTKNTFGCVRLFLIPWYHCHDLPDDCFFFQWLLRMFLLNSAGELQVFVNERLSGKYRDIMRSIMDHHWVSAFVWMSNVTVDWLAGPGNADLLVGFLPPLLQDQWRQTRDPEVLGAKHGWMAERFWAYRYLPSKQWFSWPVSVASGSLFRDGIVLCKT